MSWPLEPPVLGNIEEFREPRILVAAQRRIDCMIGNDPRFLGVIADARSARSECSPASATLRWMRSPDILS